MPFNDDTHIELGKALNGELVQQRPGPRGKMLDYLPGYVVINHLNRIFGYDGWSYEVTNINIINETVIANVAVTVHDGERRSIVREDVGFGDGDVELAHKEAVTDALKRAARTFGNQFGNSLYGEKAAQAPQERRQPTRQEQGDEEHSERPTCESCGTPVGLRRDGTPWRRCYDCQQHGA